MSAKLIYISDLGKLFRKLFDFNPDIAKRVQSARSVGFLNPTALSISISNAKQKLLSTASGDAYIRGVHSFTLT
jgi:hypothetical protein